MPEIAAVLDYFKNRRANETLQKLYGNKYGTLDRQNERYIRLVEEFTKLFPGKAAVEIFSTPGRIEVGGNHTDHNAGRVLAATVDLDTIAAAAKNNEGIIRVKSEGHPQNIVNISELLPSESEKYTSSALIRGICAKMKASGYKTGGFDAYTTSAVLKGSGLSSSAAFEVLIVTILNHLYNDGSIDNMTAAQVGRYSENNFFGKPCGLMDQAACASGGLITIDFKDSEDPKVSKIDFDFTSSGFSIVIVDTGGSHADLTEDYTALQVEMKDVAGALGGNVLREFTKDNVLGKIGYLRTKVNDRAILRAIHFYNDDLRVVSQVEALKQNDFNRFLSLVKESGYSSWMLCQNCYSNRNVKEQGITVALALTENILKGKGAWRVHGGGFAGTILAFVPNDMLKLYTKKMRAVFGEGSCHELIIRPVGTTRLKIVQ